MSTFMDRFPPVVPNYSPVALLDRTGSPFHRKFNKLEPSEGQNDMYKQRLISEDHSTYSSSMTGAIRENLNEIKTSFLLYCSRFYSDTSLCVGERLNSFSPGFLESATQSRPMCNTNPEVQNLPPNPSLTYAPSSRRSASTASVDSLKRCIEQYKMAQDDHYGDLQTLLKEIRNKFQMATYRLTSLHDASHLLIENPCLREWNYNTVSSARRRPRLGDEDELRRHLINIYRHLHSQAQANQHRLNALESKVNMLSMHNRSGLIDLQKDPRIAL